MHYNNYDKIFGILLSLKINDIDDIFAIMYIIKSFMVIHFHFISLTKLHYHFIIFSVYMLSKQDKGLQT